MKNLKISAFVFGLAAALCPYVSMAAFPETVFEGRLENMERTADLLIRSINDIRDAARDAIQEIQRLENQIDNPESAPGFWQRSRFSVIEVRARIREITPAPDKLKRDIERLSQILPELDRKITSLKNEAKQAKEAFQRRRQTKQYRDQKEMERIRNEK